MSNKVNKEDLEKVTGGKGMNIKICNKCGEKFLCNTTAGKDLYFDHIKNCKGKE